ncbi:MAG TPA: transporter substrate-binding domain-containing protein [Streptosporangiaceae bacterium]|nr:transporter substrate-binding domain-containing protein [Streptosporangiaceae bacterium]
MARTVKFRWLALLAAITALIAACSNTSASTGSGSGDPNLGTLTPGTITVAIEPYMPYTAQENGKLIGLDSDIFNYLASQLHQKVNVVVTNFAGMLSDVQTHRVDISIGGIAWSPSRAQVGLFTDPPYYSPVALAEEKGQHITTISGLQGKSVGTVTGYIFVNAIRQIPGATLHAYQDAPSAFTDLVDGRVNALVIDTLLVIYQSHLDANSGITSQYLAPPTAAELKAHPGYSAFEPYMTGFYVPKQEKTLVSKMDVVLRQMYTNGVLAGMLKKWGANPTLFMHPSPAMAQQRHASDRPASWTPPAG